MEYLGMAWAAITGLFRCCVKVFSNNEEPAHFAPVYEDNDLDVDDNDVTTIQESDANCNNINVDNPTITTTTTNELSTNDNSKIITRNNLRAKSDDHSRTSTEIHVTGGTVYIYQSNENKMKDKLELPMDPHDIAIAGEQRPRSASDSAIIPPTPNMELIGEVPLVEVNHTHLAEFVHDNMEALLDGHEMAIAGASSSHLMYNSADSI